jgi:hypothetical protein
MRVLAGVLLACALAPAAFAADYIANWPTAKDRAVAVRCVSTDGSAFESCGGSGAAAAGGATAVTSTSTVITSSVLPTGAATEVTLASVLSALASIAVTNAGTFAVQAAATLAAETTKIIGTVNIAAGQTVGVTGTFWQATQPISAASLPLPADAATQTTLALIKAKTDNIPAQGQALAAASLPVVLTAGQVTTLTPPAAITNFANETGGNLASLVAKDFATQTTLSALNAKVTAVNTGAVTISAALPAGDNNIGNVDVVTLPALAAGTNNIGDVDVLSLPALAAGTNNIGDVDVLTLPAIPTGSNVIGAVTQSGTWNVGSITTLPALVAGAANIGTVNGSTVAVVNASGGSLSVTGPLTDAQLRATAVPVSGSFSATGSSVTIYAPNNNTTAIPVSGSFSANGSTVAVVGLNGASINVNCTGGCGSPTQAVSFIAIATVTINTGATHYTLMNHSGSTATIKVQRVDIAMYSDAAVTGVVAGYQMYLITATTVTGNGSQVQFHRIDTNDNNIAPGVTLSTGGSPTIPTIANPSVAFAAAAMTSEETTLVDPAVLYDYKNLGDKPLVLRPGRGFTIKQAPQPAAAAGKVIIRAFITQE